jgi:hypothetical protein
MSSDSCSQSVVQKELFWNTLEYLMGLDHVKPLNEILTELSTTESALNTYLNFLSEVGYEYELETTNLGVKQLRPPEEKPQIQMSFNLLEWLKFQAHFPFLADAKDQPFHKTVQNKIAVVENNYNQYDLFEPLQTMDEIMKHQKLTLSLSDNLGCGELISYIEESILDQQVLSINLNDKNHSIYPFSLVYLEGELSLIGESVSDRTLINLPLSQIDNVIDDTSLFKANYSRLEVNDFISNIRAISDQETRLVLKIHALANFENSIPRNFLGNPAMISNPSGDLIWGATVESNPEIFKWIYSLGSDVEILDPTSFKKEYLNYCEGLLKKLA